MAFRRFFIRLTRWEYWPGDVIYLPVYLYILILAARARCLYFFTASNPAIEFGGVFGEEKNKVMELVPEQYKPLDILVRIGVQKDELLQKVSSILSYPVVAKPNQGEKGLAVEILYDQDELLAYHAHATFDYLIQEYVDYHIECAVMVYTLPRTNECRVGGLTLKKYLTIVGDGASTIKELIFKSDRAFLQWERLKQKWAHRLNDVLPIGEELVLNRVGNHRLGTQFIDGNHLVDGQLDETFRDLMAALPGMYCIRFDLKCKSIDDLRKGDHFRILEINGAGAEPTEIYDHSFFGALGILFRHWTMLYRISRQSEKLGNPAMTWKESREWKKLVKQYRANLSA